MSPTFVCGMPSPWTPYAPVPWPASPVVSVSPTCEHCFCLEAELTEPGFLKRTDKHLKCCKCQTLMAEKFVEAWFRLLALQPEEEPTE